MFGKLPASTRLAFRVASIAAASPSVPVVSAVPPYKAAAERDAAYRELYTARDLERAIKVFGRLNDDR